MTPALLASFVRAAEGDSRATVPKLLQTNWALGLRCEKFKLGRNASEDGVQVTLVLCGLPSHAMHNPVLLVIHTEVLGPVDARDITLELRFCSRSYGQVSSTLLPELERCASRVLRELCESFKQPELCSASSRVGRLLFKLAQRVLEVGLLHGLRCSIAVLLSLDIRSYNGALSKCIGSRDAQCALKLLLGLLFLLDGSAPYGS